MKKTLMTLIITSFVCSPLARADAASDVNYEETTQQTPAPIMEVVSPQEPYGDLEESYEDEEDETPVGSEVKTSSNSEEKARKRQFWTNIIIACTAVIIAVVSILVVSNNNGKAPEESK